MYCECLCASIPRAEKDAGCSLSCSVLFPGRQVLSLDLKLAVSGRLTSEAPRTCLSPSLSAGVLDIDSHGLITCFLGTQTQASCLQT